MDTAFYIKYLSGGERCGHFSEDWQEAPVAEIVAVTQKEAFAKLSHILGPTEWGKKWKFRVVKISQLDVCKVSGYQPTGVTPTNPPRSK